MEHYSDTLELEGNVPIVNSLLHSLWHVMEICE